MYRSQLWFFCCLFLIISVFTACKHEKPPQPQPLPDHHFPEAIGRTMQQSCAVSGCHNQASYQNAGGLLLDTWEHLMEGGSNGSVVVPFHPENSSLLYFINTHTDLGPVATPTMPLNGTPLTRDEVIRIHSWIAAGAPDENGTIPFSSHAASRQKVYLTMQGCDLVAVIDAEKRVVMRYIPVGKTPAIESPHCLKVSGDGRFAFVSFLGGEYIQKINTESDSVVAEVHVGLGQWNVFHLSEDGKRMLLADWRAQPNGRVLMIDVEQMTVLNQYAGLFHYPHGITSNSAFTTFYITAQYGNTVYKLTTAPTVSLKQVSIDGQPPVVTAGHMDPHEIQMAPDGSRYFLTCEHSNEIRVMDAFADTLIRIIPVGIKPQEMAISYSRPLLFVTCMEDNAASPGFRGSLYAINYETYEATRIDGPFFQPHGIAVDDRHGLVYVASRNASTEGPAPHHSSSCSGRNGYYNIYDLNTLQRLPKRYEVTVEPYSADIRFK